MLVRNCAGGLVFNEDKVFILKNEKDEWVFPKGVIRGNSLPHEVAIERIEYEAGISTEILSPAGQTSYEFYSLTRQQPVCNKIIWYVMRAFSDDYTINTDEGFKDGGYFELREAMQLVTYSQDKALLNLSFKTYKNELASEAAI